MATSKSINLKNTSKHVPIQCGAGFEVKSVTLTTTAQSIDTSDAIMVYFKDTIEFSDSEGGVYIEESKHYLGVADTSQIWVKGSGTAKYYIIKGV